MNSFKHNQELMKMVMAGVASTKGNRGGGYEELLEA